MYSKLESAKFLQAGWILPVDDLVPNIAQIKQEIIPPVLDALTYNGKMTGLPYTTGIKGMVGYNRAVLDQVGLTKNDLPKTWDELYDLAARLKKDKAIDIPLVML